MSEAKVTLTREGVEKLAEHFYDGGRLSDWQQIELLHIAISALSQEAVREEALEEVAQMAQDRAASEHDDFSEFAHDVRALKREPNAAAESYESAHPKALDEPAPAAPDVASMVKRAEQNAQYWLKAGYEEPHRDLAVLNVEQAMNAYKNAMYALLARLWQGWIPVNERLPSKDSTLRVMAYGKNSECDYCGCGEMWDANAEAFHSKDWLNQYHVTHWMSLPPAPGASDE